MNNHKRSYITNINTQQTPAVCIEKIKYQTEIGLIHRKLLFEIPEENRS